MALKPIEKLLNDYVRMTCKDEPKVKVSEWTGGVSVSVEPSPRDFGKILGKGGKTFKAIRLVAHCVESCLKRHVAFGLDKPEGENPGQEASGFSADWDPAPAVDFARGICEHLFEVVDVGRVDPSSSETIITLALARSRSEYVQRSQLELVIAIDRMMFSLGRTKKRYLKSSFTIDGQVIEIPTELKSADGR
jgi:predicted RNA-binding protein YlqC (UPF0109 family)